MKSKIYRISSNEKVNKTDIKESLINIVVYALILMICNSLFKGIYVENIFYALICASIISFLEFLIKPILIVLTLPLTIATFGLLYPLANVIILKIVDIIMLKHFDLNGLFATFIIAIFISIMKIIFNNITKELRR